LDRDAISDWLIGARSELVSQDDRLAVLCVWNGLVTFVSLFFLTGAFFKSALISIFVLVSSLLGYGQRWLFRGGFVIAVLAIAVFVGAIPHPDQWKDLFHDVRALLGHRTNEVSSTTAEPEFTRFRPVANGDQPRGPAEARSQ
jgi:hypothetical protein